MLTFVAPTLDSQFPGASTNIGFFGIPGSTAKSNGITVWEPAALYIPKTTQNLATAEAFVAFFNSPAGLDVQNTVNPPSGPYAVKGAVLPNNVDQVTKDMQSYFNKPNATYPALEFLSPVKGPNLENITVEIGDGQVTPQKGAALYDQDVKAEAQQLNLPGW
jgi:raffinose/stachyose/melibiose transport system substrate-binding protein